MKRITAKTARFSAVVEKCGSPATATLWLAPDQDKDFMNAVRAQRVMTIVRENVGTKKDFGLAGFHQRPSAVYLIFPRSLKEYADKRIVGIDYDLIEEPIVSNPVLAAPRSSKKPTAGRPAARSQPQRKAQELPLQKRFSVETKVTAVRIETIEVSAKNKQEAKTLALNQLKPEWDAAKIQKRVLGIEERKS